MKNRDLTICVTNDGLFVWDTRGYFHSLKTKLRFVNWHNELGLKPMARLKQRRKGAIRSEEEILYYCGMDKEDPK